MAKSTEELFRDRFAEFAAQDRRFAYGAAFARDGDMPTVMVAGKRHKKSDAFVSAEAPWHIGSITKSFTATLILRLTERNLLSLDDPIGDFPLRHAGSMHADWQGLTLRRVLSHTAGLPANVSVLQLLKAGGSDPAAERLARLRKLWAGKLGDRKQAFAYSNIGYLLAAAVAEAVSGQAWENLVEAEIARPLGLLSLGFGAPRHPGAAWGHQSFFSLVVAKNPDTEGADNPAWMGPAGTLHLNLADLVRWGQAHLAARRGARPGFLSPESCTVMQTPVADDYGLGWMIQPLPDDRATLIWHNGSNTMWYALLAMVPERDLVVAVAMNRFDQGRGDGALKSLVRVVLDAQ